MGVTYFYVSGRHMAELADRPPKVVLWWPSYGNDWFIYIASSSLLKSPRHGESVVILVSVTNWRRLACGAHL